MIASKYVPADRRLTDDVVAQIETAATHRAQILRVEELLCGLENGALDVTGHDDLEDAIEHVRLLVEEVADITHEAWVFGDGSMVVSHEEGADAVGPDGCGVRDRMQWVRRDDQIEDPRVVAAVAGLGMPGVRYLEAIDGLPDPSALLQSPNRAVREWAIQNLRNVR